MSCVYLARTNQKISFARIHLERLKQAQEETSWNKHALIESYNESILFHLASAYDAFLREVAERYNLDTEHFNGFDSLQALLDQTGVESPELRELETLSHDQTSWLHKLLGAYAACWRGSDKQGSVSQTQSLSEIHVVQVNPDHAEDQQIIAEYATWLDALSALINRQREGMQEW